MAPQVFFAAQLPSLLFTGWLGLIVSMGEFDIVGFSAAFEVGLDWAVLAGGFGWLGCSG